MEIKQHSSTSKRNSNTEFLRIIAMLMIVVSHYSSHGQFDLSLISNSVNYLFLEIVTLGNLGVDLFILMCGYYSVSREKFDYQRIFLLWSQVVTYSVLIFCGLTLSGVIEFSFEAFIKSFLPTIFSKYWFFTTYIVFLFMAPFINKMLKILTKKQYELLLVIMLMIWGVLPTLFHQNLSGGDFTIFLLLYSLGGYIKLFPQANVNRKNGIYMVVISAGLMFGSTVCGFLLKKWIHPLFKGLELYFYHKNSLLVILLALGIFIAVVNKEAKYNKTVNMISSCMFGVYLLHDNDLIRSFLWNDVLKTQEKLNSPFLIVHCACSVSVVFCVGIIVEVVRKHTLEKFWICAYKWITKIVVKTMKNIKR